MRSAGSLIVPCKAKITSVLVAAAVALSVLVVAAAPASAASPSSPRPKVRESTTAEGGVSDPVLAAAVAAATPTDAGTLVRVIDTSRFTPASPDPSGIVYIPSRDRLQIVDSEVEEVTGAGYHGVNLWGVSRMGTVQDTGTTYPAFSKEPTGLGFDPATNSLFISDDSAKRVWIDRPGSDGRWGTSDDVVTSVNAGAYGNDDVEDPEFDVVTGHLFFLDGAAAEIYDIDPVDNVFGNGNDSMTHFDIGGFGPSDFEGLSSDPSRGTLLVGARTTEQIFEITKTGSLVRIIDVSSVSSLRFISGLALAPASNGSGVMNYWIVDRAVDNGANSSENDGKIFEITVGGSTPVNLPPNVTNPGTKTNLIGDAVSFQIQASDPDGDAISSYGASGLPAGLNVNTSSGLITGSTTTAGSRTVTISATDSKGATGSATFTWNVTDGTPPAAPAGVAARVSTTGIALTWQANTESDLAGYRVYRSLSSSGPWGSPLNGSPLTTPAYTDTTGAPNTTYFYEVRAVDTSGNASNPATTSARRSIAYVSSSTAKTNASSSLAIPRPSGVSSGDVLIAAVASTVDVSAPSGWTLLQRTSSGSVRLSVFWRSAASEPSSYGWTVGGKQAIAGTITAYRGAAGVASSGATSNGSSTQIQAPGVATSAQLSALVGVFATATNATISPPNGMAETSEIATGGKLKVAVETADEIWPGTGSTGTRTASASSAAANIGVLIALTPA